jgi:ribonuclease HII
LWRCAPKEIDAINIYWAGLLAMRRAIDGLKLAPQHLLIDAKRLKEVTIPQQAISKGDAKSASIAAASILAKVPRDALMRTLDECLPATVLPITRVILCVRTTSLCPGLAPAQAHRRSFGPVREVLGLPPLPPWPTPSERVREDGTREA